MERKDSSTDTQDSEPGAVRGSETTPRVFPRPVQPWGAGSRGERFPSPTVRSLCGSGAATASGRTASPLRKEAVPAPPRAAPTSSRKDSFPKPELGICPSYSCLCWYVSMPTLRNRIIPLQNSNICFVLKCPDRRKA